MKDVIEVLKIIKETLEEVNSLNEIAINAMTKIETRLNEEAKAAEQFRQFFSAFENKSVKSALKVILSENGSQNGDAAPVPGKDQVLLDCNQAAKVVNRRPKDIRNWWYNGKLKYKKIGNKRYTTISDLKKVKLRGKPVFTE